MKYLLCFFFSANLVVLGEEPKIRVSVAHQPLEAFKGSFLTKLRGIGIYQATVCSEADTAIRLSEGQMTLAIERGGVDPGTKRHIRVATISPVLLIPTLQRARKQSNLYKLVKIFEWSAWAGVAFVASGSVQVPGAIGLLFPVLSTAADRLGGTYQMEGADLSLLLTVTLDPNRTILLEPRGCASRVFLGDFIRNFSTYEVTIP